MAITKNIELNTGLLVENAYIRIDSLSGCKENLSMSVNAYLSQEDFTQGKAYLEQEIHSFTPSVEDGSENFIKQGYTYLKTLQKYLNAVDVLENGQML